MKKRAPTSRPIPDITDEEEAEIQRQIAEDPDDWTPTDEELAAAQPFAEAHPDLAASIKRTRGRGRPRVISPKEAVTLRLDPVTLEKFRSVGADWRAKMVEILDEAAVDNKAKVD